MSPLNVLILAPYLLLLWSVWQLSRALRRESPFNELVEGITIGRRLLPGEYPEGIESVVDLTAEFPESSRIRQGRIYRAFPILDGSPSTPAALEQIARGHGSAGRRIHPLCGRPRSDGTGRYFPSVGSR